MEYGYKKLIVHQKADSLALLIYKETTSFPSHELLGITSQIRRAAVSIPANIAEGYTRSSDKEKIRFFNIALASLSEVAYFAEFSKKLGYLSEKSLNNITDLQNEVGRLLGGFNKKLRASHQKLVANS